MFVIERGDLFEQAHEGHCTTILFDVTVIVFQRVYLAGAFFLYWVTPPAHPSFHGFELVFGRALSVWPNPVNHVSFDRIDRGVEVFPNYLSMEPTN